MRYAAECVIRDLGAVWPSSLRTIEESTDVDGVPGHSSVELMALLRELAPEHIADAAVLLGLVFGCAREQ